MGIIPNGFSLLFAQQVPIFCLGVKTRNTFRKENNLGCVVFQVEWGDFIIKGTSCCLNARHDVAGDTFAYFHNLCFWCSDSAVGFPHNNRL